MRQLPEMSKISLKKPPLVELVFGVQFGAGLITSDKVFTYYSSFLKDSYPNISEKETLPSTIEGVEKPTRVRLNALGNTRKVFVNHDDDSVIQVQDDRFVVNWRAGKWGKKYPHFANVYGKFTQELKNLYSIDPQLAAAVNQYEITYVDHIEGEAIMSEKIDLNQIFTFLNLPKPVKSMHINFSIPQPDVHGNLSVIARSGIRQPDKTPVIVLETTCRGFRPELDIDAWFAKAHEILVAFFEQGTANELHTKWNKP